MPEQLVQAWRTDHDPDFAAAVVRVAAEVLATMFFEEAVPSACEHAWLSTAVSAQLTFDGSHFGSLLLSVSPDNARSIASGFLGLDPEELTDSQPGEVILELANILCGALMSTLWPESTLSLGTPELVTSGHNFAKATHCCFTLPNGLVAVSIELVSGAYKEGTWLEIAKSGY
jgi:CheY-specific phosphatase CheX